MIGNRIEATITAHLFCLDRVLQRFCYCLLVVCTVFHITWHKGLHCLRSRGWVDSIKAKSCKQSLWHVSRSADLYGIVNLMAKSISVARTIVMFKSMFSGSFCSLFTVYIVRYQTHCWCINCHQILWLNQHCQTTPIYCQGRLALFCFITAKDSNYDYRLFLYYK